MKDESPKIVKILSSILMTWLILAIGPTLPLLYSWFTSSSSAQMVGETAPCVGISDPLECEFELFFGVPPTHDKAEKKVLIRLTEIYNSACVDSLRTELKKAVNEMAMAERLAETFGLFVPLEHKFLRWESRCPSSPGKHGDRPLRVIAVSLYKRFRSLAER